MHSVRTRAVGPCVEGSSRVKRREEMEYDLCIKDSMTVTGTCMHSRHEVRTLD